MQARGLLSLLDFGWNTIYQIQLMSRVYQSKSTGGSCPSIDTTTSATPPGGRSVRLCVVPCLAGGPVLILKLHSPSRSGGREGLLVHVPKVLDDDLGVELSPHHGYVRSYLVH
jgi:hypothetical protein